MITLLKDEKIRSKACNILISVDRHEKTGLNAGLFGKAQLGMTGNYIEDYKLTDFVFRHLYEDGYIKGENVGGTGTGEISLHRCCLTSRGKVLYGNLT